LKFFYTIKLDFFEFLLNYIRNHATFNLSLFPKIKNQSEAFISVNQTPLSVNQTQHWDNLSKVDLASHQFWKLKQLWVLSYRHLLYMLIRVQTRDFQIPVFLRVFY